eukprot:2799268-Pleurochrysis_carterae.AAC.1
MRQRPATPLPVREGHCHVDGSIDCPLFGCSSVSFYSSEIDLLARAQAACVLPAASDALA